MASGLLVAPGLALALSYGAPPGAEGAVTLLILLGIHLGFAAVGVPALLRSLSGARAALLGAAIVAGATVLSGVLLSLTVPEGSTPQWGATSLFRAFSGFVALCLAPVGAIGGWVAWRWGPTRPAEQAALR
ncbi:MAG: hypothetical protein AAGK21_08625 [Bacteroidota bacterium]